MFRLLQLIAFLLAIVATSSFSPIAAPSSSRVNSNSAWGTTRQQSPVILNAVIEKEAPLKTPGPAVLEPETDSDGSRAGATEKREKKGNQGWEVRIYNDGLNTREHVARSLVQITGMSENGAYTTMMTAHQNGIAVVGRWVYEIAEMYHEALRKQGIVCDLVPVEEES